MKCPFCSEELLIQVGTRVNCKKCKVLTAITSIFTVQCNKCNHVFQVPIQSRSIMRIKDE